MIIDGKWIIKHSDKRCEFEDLPDEIIEKVIEELRIETRENI